MNVRISDVSSAMKKQAQLPLHRAIENYDQLRSDFTGTEWEIFFEESME
jgi:hypothetical protein